MELQSFDFTLVSNVLFVVGFIWYQFHDGKVLWNRFYVNPFRIQREATTLDNVNVQEDGGNYPTPALGPGDFVTVEWKCTQVPLINKCLKIGILTSNNLFQDGFEIFVNGQFLSTFSGLHDRTQGIIPAFSRVQMNINSNYAPMSEAYSSYCKNIFIFFVSKSLDLVFQFHLMESWICSDGEAPSALNSIQRSKSLELREPSLSK